MSLEQCTFSPGTVEDSLPISFSAIDQLSLLSGIDTPARYSENEQQTDGSQACTCGKATSDCLIHPSTPEAWIAFMRDSLAKTLALLENRQEYLREPDQVFTEKSCASLAWFDQSSCSWKTYQQSLVTDWEPYSETWPRWGMTVGGSAFAHPMSERRITETDGFYLPTPTVKTGAQVSWDKTPGQTGGTSLPGYVKFFPTPTTIDAGTGRFNTSVGGSNARPTPNAIDSRDRGNMSNPAIQRRAEIGKQLNLSMVVHPTSGKLSPDWVEWLMGFPIGFTASRDWVTPKSHSKPQQPTDCSEDNKCSP